MNFYGKVDDPLWIKGPDLHRSPVMWHPYAPTKASVDAFPIACGNITVREVSGNFPGAVKVSARKELYAKTVESHLYIPVRGDDANNWAISLWLKLILESHFADIVNFIRSLKGHNPRSVDSKVIVKAKKLIAPALCYNLHLILDPNGIISKTSLRNCPSILCEKFPNFPLTNG